MFVVKVPGINGLGRTKGCENSGNAILNSLKEIYMNEEKKIIDANLLDIEEIHLDNSNLELTNKLIYENSLEIFEAKSKVIFLGGDHSISYSLTKAFFDYCKNSERVSQVHPASSVNSQSKEPCLIIFDAHPDCMPVAKGAKKFPTHEEWLRAAVESGFPPENILLIGVRNPHIKELEFLKKNNIRIITMNQFISNLHDTCDIIMEFSKNKEAYLSIDIDVIDPAFAPATGYLEPGGLTSRQFIYIIQRINKIKNLRAVDIVEINSEKDKKEFNSMTIKLGAKILSELI